MSIRSLIRSRFFRRNLKSHRPKKSSRRPTSWLRAEMLEERLAPATTTLANGGGDGSVSVTVDAYGSFGSSTTGGNAFFNPFGAIGSSGTVFESGLFFGPLGDFLTEDSFGAALPSIGFTSTTATSALSTFVVGGFTITLTQTLGAVGPGGTNLTQAYAITNNTGSNQTFNVVRHVDGDLYIGDSSLADQGGVEPDGKTLYEFDSGQALTNFVGISEPLGNDIRWTIQEFRFTDSIVTAGGIPAGALNQIGVSGGGFTGGDIDGDGVTDDSFDVTISLEEFLTIANGATATYTTVTFWGERGRHDLEITKADVPDPVFAGQDLVYGLTVTNNGPGEATDVVMVDNLPAGVTFLNAVPNQGSCTQDSGVVTCDLGDLLPGESSTITIFVTPTEGGQISNTATVSAAEAEIDASDNTVTAVTTIFPADLSIVKTDSPDPTIFGNDLTYELTVTNNGPDVANDVVVTDTLPTGVSFVSATPSVGSCLQVSGVVTCDLGAIVNGNSATITIVITPTTVGTLTNTAEVDGNIFDANLDDNTATATTLVVGAFAVNDVTLIEGNAGLLNAVFTVILPNNSLLSTVQFATANGSASAADNDYTSNSGILTFAPGVSSQTVTVLIRGDINFEIDETFFVNLSNPTGATIGDAQGVGTIVNDDIPPSLIISDVTVIEGNGGTVDATFTISLVSSTFQTATINYTTANGTASSSSDYTAAVGVLTFAAGETSKTVSVSVNGDIAFESSETFFVNLSGVLNATLADSQGLGIIANDDHRQQSTSAVANFNSDTDIVGNLDLAIPNPAGGVNIFFGNGAGALTAFDTIPAPAGASVAAADLNGDGKADLVITDPKTHRVSFLAGLGNGSFGGAQLFATTKSPKAISIDDFNNDGNFDLAVLGSRKMAIHLGNGNGTFARAVQSFTGGKGAKSFVVANLDADAFADLAVLHTTSRHTAAMLSNGNGHFRTTLYFTENSGERLGPTVIAAGDLNGDGRADVTVANQLGSIVTNILKTSSSFGTPSDYGAGIIPLNPTAIAIGDFTGDGHLDAAVARGDGNDIRILRGNGSGNLTADLAPIGLSGAPVALAVADFNGNGRLDIVAIGGNGNILGNVILF